MTISGKDLSLYVLTDELAEMILLRQDMEGRPEDTTELDRQIAMYHQELIPDKVDRITHVLKTFRMLKLAAEAEEKDFKARKLRFDKAYERLADCVAYVLEKLPFPKRGLRRLEGHTSTLSLARNGGAETMVISSEAAVPDQYCKYIVTFPHSEYLRAVELLGTPTVKNAKREVDKPLLRETLEMRCPTCSGTGSNCSHCEGTGYFPVPGAHLERGWNVRIS